MSANVGTYLEHVRTELEKFAGMLPSEATDAEVQRLIYLFALAVAVGTAQTLGMRFTEVMEQALDLWTKGMLV